MDTCQPVYVRMKNGDKYYALIVEDEKLIHSRDPKPYYCVVDGTIEAPHVPFESAAKAVKHIIGLLTQMGTIEEITSWQIGINEFLSNDDLKRMI